MKDVIKYQKEEKKSFLLSNQILSQITPLKILSTNLKTRKLKEISHVKRKKSQSCSMTHFMPHFLFYGRKVV
jgi:hypothetical protein